MPARGAGLSGMGGALAGFGRPALAVLALALVSTACTGTPSGSGDGGAATPTDPVAGTSSPPPASRAELAEIACANVDREVLLRTWRGVREDRSGDVQIIPIEPNFVNGGLTHATPFDYTQEVPLFLLGPGYVKPGAYQGAATLADVAPTTAALLKFPFEAPDGTALRQALLPEGSRGLPALVVTVVWDSAGHDVLDRWPDRWPYLRSLAPQGAWFTGVTVGASPSNTPTAHATIGTGAFPMRHGFVDEFVRVNGAIQKPNANGPAFLLEPTLADLYDAAMDNEPKVGAIATLAAHIMMMGHGAQWGTGDADLAVTREVEVGKTAGIESVRWNLTTAMSPFYELPGYVNELPPLAGYVDELDRADGALDGLWLGNDIEQLSEGFDTPARTPFQQTLVETVIEREGFGVDDIPDLLFVNYKAIDTIGHLFSADGAEMGDAVATQDAVLERFVAYLDQQVGPGRWVMILTADHGTQRDPEVSGAFMIDVNKLDAGLTATFDADGDGVPLVQEVRPTEVWLDRAELEANGFSLADVSRWFLGLTQADTFKNRNVPEPGHEADPVFAAALPSRILGRLPCLPEAVRARAS